MDRRDFIVLAAASVAASPFAAVAGADDGAPRAPGQADAAPVADQNTTRLGTTWRGAAADSAQQVGIIEIDWERRAVRVVSAVQVPGRGHGLQAEDDGGVVAAAFRYGTWLWRLDADGRLMRSVSTTDEPGNRRFAGHVIIHPGGEALLTTEFDADSGEGWIGVRDRRTLRKLDEWRSHGPEPHQLLLDPDGHVVVANGSVLRTPDGRKRDLERMDSSLALLDARSGNLRGQWRLQDRRLSVRHMAWSALPGQDRPALGLALQAEHEDPASRVDAPLLAVWDGRNLDVPTFGGGGDGYAGDIAPAEGGFVLSCQTTGQALRWRHDAPSELTLIARMQQACALSQIDEGALVIAGAKGVGRWHPSQPAMLLPWPQALALGSHWTRLAPRAA
jgi:hypothetical protein